MEIELDAKVQLDELHSLQDAVAIEAWIPPTPLWHAPLLGLSLLAFAIFLEGPDGWQLAALLVALITCALGLWDQLRRRVAKPRLFRKPARIIGFYFVISVASWLIILALLGMVSAATEAWTDQVGLLVLAFFGTWLAATVAFSAGIAAGNRWRKRLIEPAR